MILLAFPCFCLLPSQFGADTSNYYSRVRFWEHCCLDLSVDNIFVLFNLLLDNNIFVLFNLLLDNIISVLFNLLLDNISVLFNLLLDNIISVLFKDALFRTVLLKPCLVEDDVVFLTRRMFYLYKCASHFCRETTN